jgi:cytochrome c oxidase assembly factor CtaG
VRLIDMTNDLLHRAATTLFALGAQTELPHEHAGHPTTWGELALAWTLEPVVVIPLVLSGWLYFRGLRRLWQGGDRGRGIQSWEAWCYTFGWLTLFVALVSPVHAWSRMLFSVHMTQHELLMLVAAPLLVLGRPVVPMLWGMPIGWRRSLGDAARAPWWQRFWQAATNPLAATLVHAAALWVWHVPALYDATIENEWIHALMHVCFLGTALLFWWSLIHGRRAVLVYGMGVLYLFLTSVESGALGALLTVARSAIYPAYAASGQSWGLTAVEDQQLAGLIMWVPAGLVYIAAGLAMFAGWLRESDRRLERRELAERLSRNASG